MTALARLTPEKSSRMLAITLGFLTLLTIGSWSGATLTAVAGLLTGASTTGTVVTLFALGTTFTVLPAIVLFASRPAPSIRGSLRSVIRTYAAACREVSGHLGLLRFRPTHLLWAVAATALSLLAVHGVYDLIPVATDPDDPRYTTTAHLTPAMTGVSWALQGASEEWLFRGPILIVAGLAPARGRAKFLTAAVVLTTVLFGVTHTHSWPANALSAGASGAIYALLALKTRSIWPPLLAHAATNFLIGLWN